MELSETSVQIRDCPIDFIPVYVKEESNERQTDFSEVEIIAAAQHFCAIEIKESKNCSKKDKALNEDNNKVSAGNVNESSAIDSMLNGVRQNENTNINNVLNGSMYLQDLDCKDVNVDIDKSANQIAEVFIDHHEQIQTSNYNISTVTIPSEFLGINLNIKKEDDTEQGTVYTAEWLCNVDETDLKLKISKANKQQTEVPIEIEAAIAPVEKETGDRAESDSLESREVRQPERPKKRIRVRSTTLQDYKERLRRKAECMREKRRKLYEQETEEQRLQRLAKEAAKRREMRMYYETPEQRRKRLDAEAARKREYRMYNETPEDRRKRLDREAERRRIKRLSLYASETPEQRRDRLNRESAKRREARLNQYAKETQEERKERLRRDALRVREMRFTRSAIETEEERRQRLVKDALRKREVRMHGGHSVNNNFTELQTVRNFEELNDVQIRDNPDNQLGGHYLSNWMMWFQNTLAQPVHVGEQNVKFQAQNNG